MCVLASAMLSPDAGGGADNVSTSSLGTLSFTNLKLFFYELGTGSISSSLTQQSL